MHRRCFDLAITRNVFLQTMSSVFLKLVQLTSTKVMVCYLVAEIALWGGVKYKNGAKLEHHSNVLIVNINRII